MTEVPVIEEKKSDNPTGAGGGGRGLGPEGTWPWYTALKEEGGSVYMWKKELKDLQEYICEGKREASTVLATVYCIPCFILYNIYILNILL